MAVLARGYNDPKDKGKAERWSVYTCERGGQFTHVEEVVSLHAAAVTRLWGPPVATAARSSPWSLTGLGSRKVWGLKATGVHCESGGRGRRICTCPSDARGHKTPARQQAVKTTGDTHLVEF